MAQCLSAHGWVGARPGWSPRVILGHQAGRRHRKWGDTQHHCHCPWLTWTWGGAPDAGSSFPYLLPAQPTLCPPLSREASTGRRNLHNTTTVPGHSAKLFAAAPSWRKAGAALGLSVCLHHPRTAVVLRVSSSFQHLPPWQRWAWGEGRQQRSGAGKGNLPTAIAVPSWTWHPLQPLPSVCSWSRSGVVLGQSGVVSPPYPGQMTTAWQWWRTPFCFPCWPGSSNFKEQLCKLPDLDEDSSNYGGRVGWGASRGIIPPHISLDLPLAIKHHYSISLPSSFICCRWSLNQVDLWIQSSIKRQLGIIQNSAEEQKISIRVWQSISAVICCRSLP